VFTPKGKILALPGGATPVDFAYAVHTDIGHHCMAARINGELMPLRTELRNGDTVEVITSPQARPNPSWISFVTTGKARSRIRHFLKTLQARESSALGERMLNQALESLKVDPQGITAERWDALLREYGARNRQEVLADIGLGKRLSFVVAQALARSLALEAPPAGESPPEIAEKGTPLTLRGVEGVAIQYARCCRPIPGDEIVGSFRRGQGLFVHTRDCQQLRRNRAETEQLVDVEWSNEVRGEFDAGVRLLVKNQRGVLAKLAAAIANAGANIENVSMERADGEEMAHMFFLVLVGNRGHLAHVIRDLRRIPEVLRVQRART
jgi:GTP pyrophosphokinase